LAGIYCRHGFSAGTKMEIFKRQGKKFLGGRRNERILDK
jgi:hypothetical protein